MALEMATTKYFIMNLEFTICENPKQKIHRVLDWNEIIQTPRQYTVLRARDGLKLFGQVALRIDDGLVGIFYLAVNPKMRGQGIGTKLMAKAEKEIKKMGYNKVWLRPQKDFEDKLIPWYESLGYEKLFHEDEENGRWVMGKKLK